MKADKYEEDCRIPFKLEWRVQCGSYKACGITVKDGKIPLGYIPIPNNIRFGKEPFIRYLKSDKGQKSIEEALLKKNQRKE